MTAMLCTSGLVGDFMFSHNGPNRPESETTAAAGAKYATASSSACEILLLKCTYSFELIHLVLTVI